MALTVPILLGRFAVGAVNNDFTVNDGGGDTALVIPSTTYHTSGHSGEGANQLVEAFQALLVTVDAGFTAVHNTTTNRVTLDFTAAAGNTTVTWDDSDVGLLLGFPSALSGADTYVASQPPRYTWMPSHGPSEWAGQTSKLWIPEHSGDVQISENGSTHTVPGYTRYIGYLEFQLLPEADIQAATTTYRDLEQFFLDVVGPKPQPIRILTDRTSYTATSYQTGYVAKREGGVIGPLDDLRSRWRPNYDGLWTVELPLVERA